MIARYNRTSWVYGLPGLLLQIAGVVTSVWAEDPNASPIALVAGGFALLIGTVLLWIGIGYAIKAKSRSLWWLLAGFAGLLGLLLLALLKDLSPRETREQRSPVRNWSATLSSYLGIASVLPVVGLVPTLPSLIFGVVGLRRAIRVPERGGRARALAGIILPIASLAMYTGIILLSGYIETRQKETRDSLSMMQSSRDAAWAAVRQQSPDAPERIESAEQAAMDYARRFQGIDRAAITALAVWTKAIQRATMRLNESLDAYDQSGRLSLDNLKSPQDVEERIRLATAAAIDIEHLRGLFSNEGERMFTEEMSDFIPVSKPRQRARAEMQEREVRLNHELRSATAEIMRGEVEMLQILRDHFDHWQIGENKSLELLESFPNEAMDRYNAAVERVHAAAEAEATFHSKILNSTRR